ncbi:mediator of RNA polymerase II transcription subunit 1-like [Trifolium pratense]|uniref:mediator of RNA polymerase II transcription subunit 1-like n=1 Tax=Trifolium pratense TaxID=57577 RepID=UPI001E692117|nr:mediator of RNA polymerase II transcription subunit 1-like [Trifolium pratense]
MDRSEPALVPEWLRSAGSVAGAGNSAQHFASSSNQTDSHSPSAAHNNRNRSSKNTSEFLDRTSSSNSRRGSINGSAKHAYSSFNRNHRDKDRDREKDRSNFGDHWDRDGSDPLANLFSGRIERDTLRRSHSMVSRKQGETLPRRVAAETKSGGSSSHNNGNGLLSGGSVGSSIQKAVFDKDFPSLGAEEKQGIAEIGRVSSPGLGATASQSLPVGSSALIGGEGWTSALAEVPSIIGSSSSGSLSAHQTVTATSGSVSAGTTAALNMAEALAQAPSRARSTPQVSVKTQRLEELAIKQSRQLIPVTPSMPKALALNSSEKSKPKTAVRNAEINLATKSAPQQPSALHIASQSVRTANAKVDVPKTSGKFTDLKSVVWENGASPSSKDVSNPTNYGNSKLANQNAVASAAAPTLVKNPNNLKSPTKRKPASLDLKLGSTLDKKQSISQMKSRNDFFNLLKNKTATNSSAVLPDSGQMVSSPTLENSGEVNKESAVPSASPQSVGNGAEMTRNGNAHSHEELCRISDEKKDSISRATVYPDEEEAAFLRSLGWEENSDEDEGLTEEEINAFYQECKKLDPSTLKLCIEGMQPQLSKLFDSCASDLRGASAELKSSDPRSEA